MQLDLREAARLLGADESTLSRWVRRGELAAQLVREQYRFDPVDLLEFASARGIEVSPELVEVSGHVAHELPTLADAVRAGGVHHDVPGGDKATVLEAVVARLPLPAQLDRGFLLQMLLAREQLGSTGFGHGIAIPHARNPVVLRVPAPAVAVSYLVSAVEFDALDGKPVHTLFTMISPSVRSHLHLLALLATALRDPELLGLVHVQAPCAEVVEAIARIECSLAQRRAARGGHDPS